MLEFSATQTISHYYALLLRDLNKCYYNVKRMQRNIISVLIRLRVNRFISQTRKKVKRDISIEMKNGSRIKMVNKSKYLGTTLYSDVKLKHTPDVDRDLTVSLNNRFADFSFVILLLFILVVALGFF